MLPRFALVPVRSPLLGESRLISLPAGTEMFQFPALASLAGYSLARVGCPIQTPWDHSSCAAPPRLSQLTASFIASRCQGIHQMPFSRLRAKTPIRKEQSSVGTPQRSRKLHSFLRPPICERSKYVEDPSDRRDKTVVPIRKVVFLFTMFKERSAFRHQHSVR